MKVIFVAGMPGSGKSEAVEVFKARGLSVVNMGDVVREEARARGLAESPENIGEVSVALRREYGDEEIARRCSRRIKEELRRGRDVVVEGVRSLEEIKYFKKTLQAEFIIVAVHSAPRTRYRRLKNRGRGDDPRDWDTFVERDYRELGYGMGSAIALADYMVVNEGALGELREKIDAICRSIAR
jgi:dephospho-CoA kinase